MEPTTQPIPADGGSKPGEDDKADRGLPDGDAPGEPQDPTTPPAADGGSSPGEDDGSKTDRMV